MSPNKASSPIEVVPDGIIKQVRLVLPENAQIPINITDFGIKARSNLYNYLKDQSQYQ